MAWNLHEDLQRPGGTRESSDRDFGIGLASVLAVLALWPLAAGQRVRLPVLGMAGVFLAAAWLRPALLHPLNRLWIMLGWLLGRVVNPVTTAVLFFLIFTPAGLISRLMGKDLLHLKPVPDTDTYWITRHPPGPPPESMSKQF